jgi:hypothetical protein
LSRGNVEGVDDTQGGGDGHQVPDLHPTSEGEKREQASQAHRSHLGSDHDMPPVVTVCHGPAHGREEEDGDTIGESNHAEEHGRAGEAVHQPALGH